MYNNGLKKWMKMEKSSVMNFDIKSSFIYNLKKLLKYSINNAIRKISSATKFATRAKLQGGCCTNKKSRGEKDGFFNDSECFPPKLYFQLT
jgi:hypothetical protein